MVLSDKRTSIGRILERIRELQAFDISSIRSPKTPAEIPAIEARVERTLERAFGEQSADYKRFKEAAKLSPFFAIAFEGYPGTEDYRSQIQTNIEQAIALLNAAIAVLNEDIADEERPMTSPTPDPTNPTSTPHRVFIVHGRDATSVRHVVARFVTAIGFSPIILNEQPNIGRTILEKFRDEAKASHFAIVLLTPDDMGGLAGDPPQARARQNVVFEFGFFFGALGMASTVALMKDKVEKPSDIDGLVYVSLDDAGAWKTRVAKEMEKAGFTIDYKKVADA